jgi:hypothetical protein
MPKRLESAYSVTVDMDDERSVFQGHLRIVRSARRARALRKRGVEVDCYNNPLGLGNGPTRFWTWYETEPSYDARAAERKRRALLRRAIREAKATGGLDWVDALLRRIRVTIVAPENPNGLTYDMSKASVYYDISTPEARAQAWAESHEVELE